VIGVNLFKGKLYYCNSAHIVGMSTQQQEKMIVDKWDCINYGGEWQKYHTHFDDVQTAFVQMFTMC